MYLQVRRMQQMTGNIGLLNPLVLNPIAATASYNPYAQVDKWVLHICSIL